MSTLAAVSKYNVVKRTQDLYQGMLMVRRMLNSRARDVLCLLVRYLTLLDIFEYEAGASVFAEPPSLRSFVENSIGTCHMTEGNRAPVSIDLERLWSLDPCTALTELRKLAFVTYLNPGLFAIDFILVPTDHEPHLASFNPVYSLLAVSFRSTLLVTAFAGESREQRGQILYFDPGFFFREPCPVIVFTSWNPLGTLLLVCVKTFEADCLLRSHIRKLYLLKYCPTTHTIRRCLQASIALATDATMLTSKLWISEDSFFLPPLEPEGPLQIVTVTKRNEILTRVLCPSASDLLLIEGDSSRTNLDAEMRKAPRAQHLARTQAGLSSGETPKVEANYGNLFAFPSSSSLYFFCVLKCPVHLDQHDCIAVVSRSSLKLVKLINLRGHVAQIEIVQDRVFVLYSVDKTFLDMSPLYVVMKDFERFDVRDARNYYICPYGFVTNCTFGRTKTQVVSFTELELQPRIIGGANSKNFVPELPLHLTVSHRQRELFMHRASCHVMHATRDFVQLLFPGEPDEDIQGANPLDDQTVEHPCKIYYLFVNHPVTFKTEQEHEEETFVYHHPTKALNYQHSWCNTNTGSVHLDRWASTHEHLGYKRWQEASAFSAPLALLPPPVPTQKPPPL